MREKLQYDASQLLKKPKGVQQEWDVNEENCELDSELGEGHVQGHVDLVRTAKGIAVGGSVQTQVRLRCARCLKPFDQKLDLDLNEKFVRPDEVENPEAEREDTAFRLVDGHVINLAKPVREHAFLALPIKTICQPDCRGLCPQCGQNLNDGECDCPEETIDPRMAKLAELLEE